MSYDNFSRLYRKILNGQHEFNVEFNEKYFYGLSIEFLMFISNKTNHDGLDRLKYYLFSEYRQSLLRPIQSKEVWMEEGYIRNGSVQKKVVFVKKKHVVYDSIKIRNYRGGIYKILIKPSVDSSDVKLVFIFNDDKKETTI
jgi:hypothetical protein